MKIVAGQFPPLIDLIDAKFHIKGKPVFFAYGDKIYNPSCITVPPMIVEHEAIHSKRQGNDPEGWWHRYIEDSKFRLIEELLAHTGEYRYLVSQNGLGRNSRRIALARTAVRVVHPMYQYQPKISAHFAKKMIAEVSRRMDEHGYIPSWKTESFSFITS